MLKKNYQMLRFLNKDRNVMTRYFLGYMTALFTLLTTRSFVLSAKSRDDVLANDIKIAFRRCGWYSRKSWLSLSPVEDSSFVFTDNMQPYQLDAVEAFLYRVRPSEDDPEFLSDVLFILAQRLHRHLERNEDAALINEGINAFYAKCQKLLDGVDIEALQNARPAAPSVASSREGDFSWADAVAAFHDFAACLPLDEWPWFVESGTFLGLHREGGFLAHDYDIDVGIDLDQCDLERLLVIFAESEAFVVKKLDRHWRVHRDDSGQFRLESMPAIVKLIHRNGINLDIFLHHIEDGDSCHGSSVHWWRNRVFDLERRELEGVVVNAPKQADRYLTENYGDWRTPVTDFDCTSGTPNLSIARNFLSIALFLKRLAVFSVSSPREALKVKAALVDSGVIRQEGNRLIMCEYI